MSYSLRGGERGFGAGHGSPRGFNLGWRAALVQWERRTRDRNAVWRQNEKTDLVPCSSGIERCTGHYVEHWYRKSGHCSPNPADHALPWLSLLHTAVVSLSPRSVLFPCVLETLEVWEAPSHTLTSQCSEFNSICVSRENFSFCISLYCPSSRSVTHCGLTRAKKRL